MFRSSSEKTPRHTTALQKKAAGTTFFRKAGEESFFGEKASPAFFNSSVQTKLNVSSPDDPQEKEADAVADRVMRMADPAPVASDEKKEGLQRSEEDQSISGEPASTTIQCKEGQEEINRKEEKEEEKVQAKPIGVAITIQAKEENKDEKIHPKLSRKIHRSAEHHEPMTASDSGLIETYNVNRKEISIHHSDVIQRSGRGPPQNSIPFEQSLSSSKGGGSALPGDTKQFMESRFNADFSGVKIHTGSKAETLSSTIHAQAFTHGNDIYFNSGKYSPNTADGGSLLAHELTHTIQQGASHHNSPSQNNSSNVAAKLKVQRQQNIPASQVSSALHTPETPENLRMQRPLLNNRPRSLRDMRKDAFNIDRKEENCNDNNSAEEIQESTIQPKNELSNWSINPSGNLLTTPTPGIHLPVAAVQSKEEGKEIKKEEEEKLQTSIQPQPQKKSLSLLQRKNESDTVTSTSTSQNYSVQPETEFNDSSLNHETDGATSDITNERDRGPPGIQAKSRSGVIIQRSWLGDAWDAVSGFVGEAAEVIAGGLDAAKEWILRRIKTFVQNIPGYNLLALILQHDPITHEPVERSGRNILLAGLQLIPGGTLFQAVLERIDAINEAGAWIDGRIGDLLSIVSGIGNRFTQFMSDLSLDDIGNPEGVLNRVADLFSGNFNDVTGFMVRAATDFLEMIKRIMLRLIVDFVRERVPRLYPLLRVAMGHDPVTGEDVPRNGHNILYAALDATDAGREQRRQMEETGTFDRVAAWIDRGIAVFSTAYQLLRQAFTNLWASVTIENLFSPVETFTRIYNDFAAPISLVGTFLRDLAIEIVRLIKDALLRRLRDYARTVRGYFLISVIIGRDPITGEVVPRTIPNIIRGFMSLMEGGEEQYRQMEESGAIARTTQRIEAAVARLNMTPASIIQLFIDLWNSFGLDDLANPLDAFMRIVHRFGEPIARLIAFVIEIVKIVIHVILEIMNFPFDLINNIITRSMAAFERIKRDPIGFLKNLLRAIKQGFIQFFNNILTHLLGGLTGWLMSELRDANVPIPTDFTLRGIIGWVLQVLGVSMEAIWAKLAAHPRIGPQKVERIKGMINTLEGIWTFIKDVQERGVAAIWDKIQEQLSNLWFTVLDAVKNWVMERIIIQVTLYLLGLLDPTGIMAVINSAISIYRAIQSFIRYLRQMLEIVNSFVNGVADIAEGNIATAANYLESTMSRAMPIVVGFLADQVGLRGVGRRIAEIIGRVREMVDRALTWLVNKAVDTGMNVIDRLMTMGRQAVGAVRDAISGWLGLRKTFRTRDGNEHAIYFRGSGVGAQIVVASQEQDLNNFFTTKQTVVSAITNQTEKTNKQTALATAQGAYGRANALKPQIDTLDQIQNKTPVQRENLRSLTDRQRNEFTIVGDNLAILGIDEVAGQTITSNVQVKQTQGSKTKLIEAFPLTPIPGNTRGSAPIRGAGGPQIAGWTHLIAVNREVGNPKHNIVFDDWLRMHLIHEHMHGPAQPSNLVPANTQPNTAAYNGVERQIVERLRDRNALLWYETTVEYRTNQPGKSYLGDFPESVNIKWSEVTKQEGSETLQKGTINQSGPYSVAEPPPLLGTGTSDPKIYIRSLDSRRMRIYYESRGMGRNTAERINSASIHGRGGNLEAKMREYLSTCGSLRRNAAG